MRTRSYSSGLAALVSAAALALAGAASAATTTTYQALVQSRTDAAAPFEVYLASFANLDDVFSGTVSAPTGFTDIAISPDFEIAGFTHDPDGYRALVESRADAASPFEVYLATFATLDDVSSSTLGSPTGFTEIAISPDFQIAGFTYDPGGYRVLVESRADAASPFEVYLATFATLDDLFNGLTGPRTGFTEIAISPDFQIAGFASTTVTVIDGDGGGGGGGGAAVPEPATWALLLMGFGGLGAAMRRSRRKAAAQTA